jgi:hypothetical protein
MPAKRGFVVMLDPQAEMIEIPSFDAGRCAASLPQLAVDGDQIDQRTSRAQMHQTEIIAAPVDTAAKNIAIKKNHRFQIGDTKHKVVYFPKCDHRNFPDNSWIRMVLSSSARMMLRVQFLQPLARNVGVNLRSRNIGVAEQ